MILERIDHGAGDSYPEYSEDGTVISVGGETFDAEELQSSGVTVKNIFRGSDFIANLFIPSPRFRVETAEDEEGEIMYIRKKEPVDMQAVKLVLWELRKGAV